MAQNKTSLAGRFAHLIGRGTPDAAHAEDGDDRKKRDNESDDDYAKRMKALDDEEDKQREKEEEEARAAADDNEEGDDSSDGDDMKKGSKARNARLRERNRCAAIFATPEAAANPALAAELAFGPENLSRGAAIRVLKASTALAPAQAQGRVSLDERMARTRIPNPGPGDGQASEQNSPAAAAAAIVQAARKARGEAA